jgi:hypothetical protein
MDQALRRYRRRDAFVRTSAIAAFSAIALGIALPLALPQSPGEPIPLFKPYRVQATAELLTPVAPDLELQP